MNDRARQLAEWWYKQFIGAKMVAHHAEDAACAEAATMLMEEMWVGSVADLIRKREKEIANERN